MALSAHDPPRPPTDPAAAAGQRFLILPYQDRSLCAQISAKLSAVLTGGPLEGGNPDAEDYLAGLVAWGEDRSEIRISLHGVNVDSGALGHCLVLTLPASLSVNEIARRVAGHFRGWRFRLGQIDER